MSALRFGFAGFCVGLIFVEILHTVFINEQVRLRFPGDADDVLVVILDPAPDLFAVDQFDDDGRFVFREAIDVFGFAERSLWRGLPPISAACVFMRCTYGHAPQYSVFDVKIQE